MAVLLLLHTLKMDKYDLRRGIKMDICVALMVLLHAFNTLKMDRYMKKYGIQMKNFIVRAVLLPL